MEKADSHSGPPKSQPGRKACSNGPQRTGCHPEHPELKGEDEEEGKDSSEGSAWTLQRILNN